MRFKVMGADKRSGDDRELVIDAPDARTASEQANAQGLLVAECVQIDKVNDEPTKPCPYCAESINPKAIKCRWCGEMLDKAAVPANASPPPLPLKNEKRPPQAASRQSPIPPSSPRPPSKSSAASRLARGGVLGLVDESYCVPEEQMRLTVKGEPTMGKTVKRLASLAAIAVVSFVVLIVLAIGAAMMFGGDGTSKSSALRQSAPISATTFIEFDSTFCTYSKRTNLQKDRDIERYKGRRVQWEGIVSYVSDDSVGFKHKATTSTYDVLLRVSKGERSGLVTLNEGDLVTYEGTIDDYGVIMPHGLSDGRIVSRRSMSSGDQLIFLANTETAVMKRIGGEN